jgi:dihydroorotate dehydrogenase (fumarate)
MSNLSTYYMGLQLDNPLVVASSSLTNSLDGVRRCADAGAGALVLKSLFEEQIKTETENLEEHLWLSGHPEAFEYLSNMSMELGPREYLSLINDAKKTVAVPVIASMNCITPKWWVEYARQIEAAGADALELNLSIMPSEPARPGEEIENLQYRVFDEVKGTIDIPIAVKIGPYFTSIARVVREFAERGASALVLFNRFYHFDIDVDKIALTSAYHFSTPEELHLPLRWIALLSGRVDCDLAASTGIHDGQGAIKQLLAGAAVVQLCSTLYTNGMEHIGRITEDISRWMARNNFESITQFQGKLSQVESDRPELYERLQYIKALVGIE